MKRGAWRALRAMNVAIMRIKVSLRSPAADAMYAQFLGTLAGAAGQF